MSIRSAPRSTAIRAASAIASGSQPASCTEFGPVPGPASAISAMRSVDAFSRTMAQDAIISDTTSPAPSRRARRRYGRSVTPDIGARITGRSITTPPRSMARRRAGDDDAAADAAVACACKLSGMPMS